MFEVSIAFKYLIPRKKHLSVTLIAMMSVTVISLVVWLLLVFLSITEGMELGWLKKLTDLNAPIRITPKEAYFSSYYYKIDSISSASRFALKTLGEKRKALRSDPYDLEEDPEIPINWPAKQLDCKGELLDPVKGLESILETLQSKEQSLHFQDYEMSGAMLKLQLLRNHASAPFSSGEESMHFLTQVSYLATPPSQGTTLIPLLTLPSSKDLNHLFFLTNYRMENTLEDGAPTLTSSAENFQEKIQRLIPFVSIHSLKTVTPNWQLPGFLLPKKTPLSIYGFFQGDQLIQISFSSKKENSLQKGFLVREENELIASFGKNTFHLPLSTHFSLDEPLSFQATIDQESLKKAGRLQDIFFHVKGSFQGKILSGLLPWKDLLIDTFTLTSHEVNGKSPPWIYAKESNTWALPLGPSQENGALLPKSFQDSGVLLGDKGFLSYTASTSSSRQEQRLPIFVAGFYDPGVISVGNKCLLVSQNVTRAINSTNTSFTFDKIALNGFQVWIDHPEKAEGLKKAILESLSEKGLSSYWNVTSYKEYEFAKDLLQQFQSDKLLLALIGLIILIVACSNIISFLILLVSDKKKEIAILQAMGASSKSIALIFGICGVFVGILGCAIGIFSAVFTLKHMDLLAQILSQVLGHEAFHPTFYGNSLPSVLSSKATLFIFIATPLLSLLSGLIPAIKASKLSPSSTLRSES